MLIVICVAVAATLAVVASSGLRKHSPEGSAADLREARDLADSC